MNLNPITYRELHEEIAGMGLDEAFFKKSGINPDAPVKCNCKFEDGHQPSCDIVAANDLSKKREKNKSIRSDVSDSDILDWLERNLISLSHAQATSSVFMDGKQIFGQLINEARGAGGGPRYFRVNHRSLREAVIEAMNWTSNKN